MSIDGCVDPGNNVSIGQWPTRYRAAPFHPLSSVFWSHSVSGSKCYGLEAGVVVLDGDHLVHVPMSLRARTSALDLLLLLKRSVKVY